MKLKKKNLTNVSTLCDLILILYFILSWSHDEKETERIKDIEKLNVYYGKINKIMVISSFVFMRTNEIIFMIEILIQWNI